MTQFRLPMEYDEALVTALLEPETAVLPQEAINEKWTLYDTFDWRLYKQALALYSSGNQFVLRDLARGETAVQAELAETPQFVWDVAPGLLRARLSPILGVRALLPLAHVRRQQTTCRLLNKDEKTVAWLLFEKFCAHNEPDSPGLHLVQVQPVRGYTKTAARLSTLLAQQGFAPLDEEIIPLLLKASGLVPGSYSASFAIELKPDMRSDTAVNIILRHLLQVMKLNERFIQQDIDTEFLHDYRVAVRRTRSALSQIKAVFPESQTNRFKEDFKYIGQLSNQLRDLDVYLLAETEYKKQLPEFLRSDIDPLFDYLQSKREGALQAVTASLEAPEYRRILQEWELFLEEPPPEDKTAVNAAMPILKLAQKRIYKRVRGILKEGHSILQDNRDERLHALRLECKKLRYLMEFFASLFPPDDISHLIRQLKQLQGNLGDFNDLCVQEVYLLHVAREMPLRSQASRDALIAIGCLVGALHQRREQVKSEFAATFNAFAAPANEALFIKCFAPKKAGKKQKKGGRS